MRKYAWLFLSMGLTFGLVGCGDSGSNGGGAGGSGGDRTATVSGTVFSAALEGDSTPLAGATVSVVGASTSTVSGPDGSFSLEAPVGITRFLTTAADSWGELLTGDVPATGVDMADPEVVPETVVDEVAAALMPIDDAKGMVIVDFDTDVAAGGEAAELSGATYGFAFVFDDAGEPVLGKTLIAGGDGVVIFANVDISADVMPTAMNAGGACALDPAGVAYPSQAKVFTVVDLACP